MREFRKDEDVDDSFKNDTLHRIMMTMMMIRRRRGRTTTTMMILMQLPVITLNGSNN